MNKEAPSNRAAVDQSLKLLDKTTTQFFTKSGCCACHEQPPGEFAAAVARAKGISVDEKASRAPLADYVNPWYPAARCSLREPLGGADINLYSVEALVRSGYAPERVTDFLAANIAAYQGSDGGCHLPGYSRSPIRDSVSRTATAIRALKKYGTPGRVSAMQARIERGKRWLLHSEPVILEDLTCV